ncbi:hypothetical protein CEXT_576361 [Caerostris extrusa]|uniref:Uncharacterized protein n=1 Tax=Caerostris extrusa TaxID=172846 RepID=A0AAV4UWB6_CAEEX|nr:hypothetical protein CEXT_576361 [Caerostris extrusa]
MGVGGEGFVAPCQEIRPSETAVICTDEARQDKKIDRLFKGAVHKTTNHSKGEFVDKNDTINPLRMKTSTSGSPLSPENALAIYGYTLLPA